MFSHSKLYNILIFVIILTVSLVVFFLLESFLPLAFPVIAFFNYLGFVNVAGQTLMSNTLILINYECSGFFSIFILFALIFSPITKLAIKNRLIVFLLGSIFLYLANILRLLLLFTCWSVFGVDFLHIFGWFLMSAIIFCIWYFWCFKSVDF